MPDNSSSVKPPSGSSFAKYRESIFRKLKESVEKCKNKYDGRATLASEEDEIVSELCDSLDELLNYGLRQHGNFVVTAASLFQNMQEIMTGNSSSQSTPNDTTFWIFCQNHLTSDERARFENLKNVWTNAGRGKSFVRAALNENSLHRYFLTWMGDRDLLERYFTPWSIMLYEEYSKQLPDIISGLDKIIFALGVDTIELNKTIPTTRSVVVKDEPIIYAPKPIPIAKLKIEKKLNAVERPIATKSPIDEIKTFPFSKTIEQEVQDIKIESSGGVEEPPAKPTTEVPETIPFDPIEPEIEFLKQPLPDSYSENQTLVSYVSQSVDLNPECEDKSDTSSQYSKSSSAGGDNSNCAVLEEKLRDLTERYALLETRVAQLSLENRQLVRRLTKCFNESGIDPTSSFGTNFLITIPTVKLIQPKGATSLSYYAYDVHITMRHRLEHWSVLRRYREFDKLHRTLLRTHPSVATVEFPPKKRFGNKNQFFVDERRQQLQIYLLNLIECLPQVEACKTKVDLQKVFPFLRER